MSKLTRGKWKKCTRSTIDLGILKEKLSSFSLPDRMDKKSPRRVDAVSPVYGPVVQTETSGAAGNAQAIGLGLQLRCHWHFTIHPTHFACLLCARRNT